MIKPSPRPPEDRPGPRPLALHLAMQTLAWSSSLLALPSLKNGSLRWSPGQKNAASALARDLAGVDADAFAEALQRESRRRLAAFADGVGAYRKMAREKRPEDPPSLWAEGSVRLLDYGRADAGAPTVLFVPSLVNRATILDLAPGQSLMADLAGRGLRPLLVDWGTPGPEEMGFGLDQYIAGRLEAALDAALRAAAGPVAVAGYCMGGLLALALAARRPDDVSALALLATPWDFHAMDAGKTRMLEASAPIIERMLDAVGFMPVDVLQAMFSSLDPWLTPAKFRAFAGRDADSRQARDFVALEDWLNDGVPLAGPVARECLIGWYVDNLPGRGLWRIAGTPVRPADIACPSLIVVPMRDHIVPPASALPLGRALPRAETLKIAAGHIGMMVGTRAERSLYRPLGDWLLAALRG